MDEFGRRLSDVAIKNLFIECPPYKNEALCDLFNLKMSFFEKYFQEEVPEVKLDADEINRLYQEKFYEYDPEDTRKKRLAEYENKLTEEELQKLRKILEEPPPTEVPIPDSYLFNSPDEEELIKLGRTFQDQYRYLYPNGPRNILCLPNEHGVLKIVSTTLCPFFCTRLKLRSWKSCVEFVADFLNYEPLKSPPISPTILVSPELTMKHRKGNSLDFSTVLCSMLISADYDAFVVQGYATKLVCERDLSKKTCPEIFWLTKSQQIRAHANCSTSEKNITQEVNKYDISEIGLNIVKKSSKYLDMMEQKKLEYLAFEVAKSEEVENSKFKQLDIASDVFYGKRIHFWILVKPGRRDISEAFFLEPSSGEKVCVSCAEYMGIEFVWNHHNFWLNKQRVGESCSDIDFDVDNIENWDYFLPINSHGDSFQSDSERMESVPMPPSWVRCYDVTLKELCQPLPEDKKVIVYHKAKLEKFNEFVLEDGCTLRKTVYVDDECNVVGEIQELFKNRSDLLIFRQSSVNGKVKEIFDEGRSDSLKEHAYNISNPKSRIEMLFYPGIRADGLVKRNYTEEYIENEYLDRKDRLIFRKETYLVFSKEFEPVENEPPVEIPEAPLEVTQDLLTPYSFDDLLPMFQKTNFSKWRFEDFLNMLDSEYQYFSDSEEEDGIDNVVEDAEILMTEASLAEEHFENDYNVWLANLYEEIQKENKKDLVPICEGLTENKDELLLKKKVLKQKIRDQDTRKTMEEGEQNSPKTYEKTIFSKLKKHREKIRLDVDETGEGDFISQTEVCETENKELDKKRRILASIFRRKNKYRKQCHENSKLILDISEIYSRNTLVPATKDIHRRRYILDEGRYTVEFFPPDNRLSARSIVFIKPEVKSDYIIERFDFSDELYKEIEPGYETEPFTKLYIYRKLLRLIQNETKSMAECRETIKELEAFSNKIECEKRGLKLIPEHTNLDKRHEMQIMKERRYMEAVLQACKNKEAKDYLTPAFAEVGYKLPFDEHRAKQAYNYMIEDYIKSANRKINEMQKKLNKTLAKHRQKIQAYNEADEEEITNEQLQSLVDDCGNVKKVLSVLLMRCERFQEISFKKFNILKENLMTDSRLRAFTEKLKSENKIEKNALNESDSSLIREYGSGAVN